METNQEKIINDYVLKLTGKVSILEPIEQSHNYKVEIDGTIDAVTDTDNHDGTYNRYYKFLPILCKIKKDNGEVIRAKDPRKNSQKLRRIVYAIWMNDASSLPEEEAYDRFMNHVMVHADVLYQQAMK